MSIANGLCMSLTRASALIISSADMAYQYGIPARNLGIRKGFDFRPGEIVLQVQFFKWGCVDGVFRADNQSNGECEEDLGVITQCFPNIAKCWSDGEVSISVLPPGVEAQLAIIQNS